MNILKFSKLKEIACAAALCLGGIQGASAGIIFSQALTNPPDVTIIRFGLPGSTPGNGEIETVTGTTGTQRDRFLIDFAGDEPLIANVDDSPPLVRAIDGTFQQLDISVRDAVFTKMFLNFRTGGGSAASALTRYADILVSAYGGETATHRLYFSNGANANNFFTVSATDGTLLENVSISSTVGITELRQPRVLARIPEPATLLTLGIGLAGLVAARRRTRIPNAADRSSQSAPVAC